MCVRAFSEKSVCLGSAKIDLILYYTVRYRSKMFFGTASVWKRIFVIPPHQKMCVPLKPFHRIRNYTLILLLHTIPGSVNSHVLYKNIRSNHFCRSPFIEMWPTKRSSVKTVVKKPLRWEGLVTVLLPFSILVCWSVFCALIYYVVYAVQSCFYTAKEAWSPLIIKRGFFSA